MYKYLIVFWDGLEGNLIHYCKDIEELKESIRIIYKKYHSKKYYRNCSIISFDEYCSYEIDFIKETIQTFKVSEDDIKYYKAGWVRI